MEPVRAVAEMKIVLDDGIGTTVTVRVPFKYYPGSHGGIDYNGELAVQEALRLMAEGRARRRPAQARSTGRRWGGGG